MKRQHGEALEVSFTKTRKIKSSSTQVVPGSSVDKQPNENLIRVEKGEKSVALSEEECSANRDEDIASALERQKDNLDEVFRVSPSMEKK